MRHARPTMSTATRLPEYARFRRHLVLGLVALACLIVIAVAWKIHTSAQDRIHAARIQSQTYVQAIAAHVSDAVLMVDYKLNGFAAEVSKLPPEQQRSSATMRRLLASHAPAVSDDFEIKFIDAAGFAIAENDHAGMADISFAQRDFFQFHAAPGPDTGLFVGQPVNSLISQRHIFTLSRRILDARGNFLGVVVAPIDASRFAALFELARLNKDISIMLVHRDGKIIARAPEFAPSFRLDLANSTLLRLTDGERSGTVRASSPLSGQSMLYSFSTFQHDALKMVVGVPLQSLTAAWHQDLLIGAIALALMAAIMLLVARMALLPFRRLEINKQALQESELRWTFALEGAGDGVWEWDLSSNELYFSQRCINMLGYAKGDIAHTLKTWQALLHPHDSVRVNAELAAYVAGEAPLYLCEYRMQCKDGSWKWILGRGKVLLRDGDDHALRMIGTIADITGRRQAEQLQVHKIIEAAPDPMLLVDNDGCISVSNTAALSTFGYTPDQLTGMHIDQLVPLTSRGIELHLHKPFERIAQRMYLTKQMTALHKDGDTFSVEIGLSTFQMGNSQVVIVNLRDVTERERKSALLLQSFAQLRRLADHQEKIKENERKRIAQDIHDELGQNLLVLKMDVATLHARTAAAHPMLHQRANLALANIDATIKSVKAIMNDLRPATLELGLGPAVEWQLRQFERSSGIACTLAAHGLAPCFGLNESCTAAIFRILQESLTNVARHAKASQIDIILRQDQYGFSMKVKDDGRGLQPGDRKKINSFGLMGIRERIDGLGGELVITSRPGQGTVLSIFIAHPP
jgi:PAS domain S-box-containing protein